MLRSQHMLGFRGPHSVYFRKAGELRVMPKRPDDMLSEPARAEWTRVAPRLHVLGLLSRIDVLALAGYCKAFADYTTLASTIDDLDQRGATLVGAMRRQRHSDFHRVRSWALKFGVDVDESGRMVLPDAP